MDLEKKTDCPECDLLFVVDFDVPDGVEDADELIDVPERWVECPDCGETWVEVYTGWTAHEDAG